MISVSTSQSTNNQMKNTIIIILGFWIIYYLFYLLEEPVWTFLSSYITMRSEYSVQEQLTKFYLFTIILISIFSYQNSSKPVTIKLAISFLLLGLVIYMSESNMIREKVQPIFGLIIVSSTAILLLRSRLWLGFFFLIAGFAAISGGSLVDHIHERESVRLLIPDFIFPLLDMAHEERFDVVGIAFLCLSAIMSFHMKLWDFVLKNKKGTLLLLLTSSMITVGNGLLHWQYGPSKYLQYFALIMTVVGFLGLMFVNKKGFGRQDAALKLITEGMFYMFIFFFFVMLPSNYGDSRASTSMLVWLPFMLFMAVYLWRFHPSRQRGVSDD